MANTRIIGKHKTKVIRTENTLAVKYVNTVVVYNTPSRVVLNTGGWKTNTTKTRMNQAANQYYLGYQVFQKNYNWYVKCLRSEKIFEFENDGIVLDRYVHGFELGTNSEILDLV